MGLWEIVAFACAGAAVGPAARALAERELPVRLGGRTRTATVVALAVVAGVAAWPVEPVLAAVASACALGAAVPIAVVDAAAHRIPNRIVFPALAASASLIVVQGLTGGGPVARALAAAGIFFAILGSSTWSSPRPWASAT